MSISIYFNPLDKACKNVVGAVREGDLLQLNIFLLKKDRTITPWGENKTYFKSETPTQSACKSPDKNAFLRLNHDGETPEFYLMTQTDFGWSISLRIHEVGLYYYSFYVETEGNIACGDMEMGYVTQDMHDIQGFLLTVYSKDYKTPDWFKGGVMYQIFPDRFCKVGTMPHIKGRVEREWGELPYFRPNEYGKILNNDFFGGNFKGIESKLPYLRKLGVTTIYLNPIFEATSNHRYDTGDYKKLDPYLGTEKDFTELVQAAEEHGIRIILDGVFNHTGDDSLYFNKYGNYPELGAYQSQESPYHSWYKFDEFPNKYRSWWGIDILPEINKSSKEYQEFILGKHGVLNKWLGFGIGGYRLDVADELPSFFLKSLRKSVKKSNPEAIIIGEVWEDASDKIAYSERREYLQGHELDSVMNYPLKDAIIRYIQTENAATLVQTVRALVNHYPKQTIDCLMNILGTHDTVRILTVLGGIHCSNKEEMACSDAYLTPEQKEIAIQKLKMAAVLQYTMPGVPCLYYGDENGAEGHRDPFCRTCFDWKNKNDELIRFYSKLGKLRKEFQNVFKDGEFKELEVNGGFLLYKRKKANEEIYIYVNNSSARQLLTLPNKCKDYFTNKILKKQLTVEPYSYGIFKKIIVE